MFNGLVSKIFLIMLLCFPAASQAVVLLSSPASNDDGIFVVSWQVDIESGNGRLEHSKLYERVDGGPWVMINDLARGTGSMTMSKYTSGTYEYQIRFAYGVLACHSRGCTYHPATTEYVTSIETTVVSIAPGVAYEVEIIELSTPSLTTGEFNIVVNLLPGTSTCKVGDEPPTIKVLDSSNNFIYSTFLALSVSGKTIQKLVYEWNNNEGACIYSTMIF